MAYLTRSDFIFDDDSFHVTWQCHNQKWLLRWEWSKKLYYDLLLKYKDKYGVEIYSYNFMDNHLHLSGKLTIREEFSNFFKVVNAQFAKRVNKRLKRKGQVVMDRFKSPRIKDDDHLLSVMGYIDLNQVRVGKVASPEANRWSSYRYYAYGMPDPLITPAPTYLGLGRNDKMRQEVYREMVQAIWDADEEMNISHTYFIGDPDWVSEQYRNLRETLKAKRRKIPPPDEDES